MSVATAQKAAFYALAVIALGCEKPPVNGDTVTREIDNYVSEQESVLYQSILEKRAIFEDILRCLEAIALERYQTTSTH